MEDHRSRPQSRVSLQSGPVLGRGSERLESDSSGGAEQSRRRRLDQSLQAPLRKPRHGRTVAGGENSIARMYSNDELGRTGALTDRAARNAGGARAVKKRGVAAAVIVLALGLASARGGDPASSLANLTGFSGKLRAIFLLPEDADRLKDAGALSGEPGVYSLIPA